MKDWQENVKEVFGIVLTKAQLREIDAVVEKI